MQIAYTPNSFHLKSKITMPSYIALLHDNANAPNNQISFPESCPAGTYKGETDSDCVQCGPNTVSAEPGATHCNAACSPGAQPNAQRTRCGKGVVFTLLYS